MQVGVPVGPEVRVVDRENIDVPLGEDGEILIRGAPLFSGYTGEDNSSTFSAEGWFRTGDRGKLDAEGNLYIIFEGFGHCLMLPSKVSREMSSHGPVATQFYP